VSSGIMCPLRWVRSHAAGALGPGPSQEVASPHPEHRPLQPLSRAKQVCKNITVARRRASLTFSHHQGCIPWCCESAAATGPATLSNKEGRDPASGHPDRARSAGRGMLISLGIMR
jgi:hypothetical protein